jgi:GDP/UDP-N,N'-diacetylbacillosamine 2-epimerase (hydrolysing)
MNIPVAHTQGGEVSGSIDESVRHAITKLSHIHFPATGLSARRIIAMGEDPQYVFNLGCPSIDLAARARPGTRRDTLIGHCGAGSPIDPDRPFLLVMQHGVTTEYGHGLDQMATTLRAVSAIGMQALVFWPNVDAGSAEVATGIRQFRQQGLADRCQFFSNLLPEAFAQLMTHCACMIGNSSAALREGAFLGTPAVSVGTRQHNRECGSNVVFTSHDPVEIAEAIRTQIAHGRYERSDLFGSGTAGRDIADVLATVRPRCRSACTTTQPCCSPTTPPYSRCCNGTRS